MSDRILKVYRWFERSRVPLAMAAPMVSIVALFFFFYEKTAWGSILGGALASVIGGILAVAAGLSLRWMRTRRIVVFVSYTHQDADFVMKLGEDLKRIGLEPLVGRLELKVGDDIRRAVDAMIDRSDYFLFVISESSIKSDWAKKELEQAMARKKKVLPVLLQNASVPQVLSEVFYADFSKEYATGIKQLQKTFGSR